MCRLDIELRDLPPLLVQQDLDLVHRRVIVVRRKEVLDRLNRINTGLIGTLRKDTATSLGLLFGKGNSLTDDCVRWHRIAFGGSQDFLNLFLTQSGDKKRNLPTIDIDRIFGYIFAFGILQRTQPTWTLL